MKGEPIPFRIVYPHGMEFNINGGGFIEIEGERVKITSLKSVKRLKTGIEVIGICRKSK